MSDQSAGSGQRFELLETILWEPDAGYFLLDEHLQRLRRAADFFKFPLNESQVAEHLSSVAGQFAPHPHRVRLLAAADGSLTVQPTPLNQPPARVPWRVALTAQPINSADPFLRHKTTRRQVYEAARAAHPDVDDVLLWNERGELTEATIANVALKFGDDLLTPPLHCGLLPGTFREYLLAQGSIREQILTPDDARRCDKIFLINSVRRWVEAEVGGYSFQEKYFE